MGDYKYNNNGLVTIFSYNSSTPSTYTFNMSSYNYYGYNYNFIKGKSIYSDDTESACWGLLPVYNDSEYYVYNNMYKYKGGNIPFATKKTSRIPTINTNAGQGPFFTAFEYSGNFTTELYIKCMEGTDSWETIISESSDFTDIKRINQEGIFLWAQAAGGGGGGGDIEGWGQGKPGGAGGGSGASALIYLATKKLYYKLGANAYFKVNMGKGGNPGNQGANPTYGTVGASVSITYNEGSNKEYILYLGGGGGGSAGIWDKSESGKPGIAGVRAIYTTPYAWVLNAYNGVAGGKGIRAGTGHSGESLTTNNQYMPIDNTNYFKLNDGICGVGSSGNGAGGGGGGSPTPGYGYGGRGSQSNDTGYSATAGGPCFVAVLQDY